MAGVVAVPEHVQEVWLRLPCPGLPVKVEALDVDLSAAGGLGELPGVLHEGLLQISHYLLSVMRLRSFFKCNQTVKRLIGSHREVLRSLNSECGR